MPVKVTEVYLDWINSLKDLAAHESKCVLIALSTAIPASIAP